jgi:hypothetical protein
MAKYRKKPIVIEASQWLWGDPPLEGMVQDVLRPRGNFKIETLEGPMSVNGGDWIITGVKGEKYPCKPDIFEATYDPV